MLRDCGLTPIEPTANDTGICRVFAPPEIVMVAETVPLPSEIGLAVTVSVEFVLPLVGLTVSHVAFVVAVKLWPAVALETDKVWETAGPPDWPVKESEDLSTVSVWPVAAVMVKVTGIVRLLNAVIVMVPCTVPTPSPVGSADTVRVAGLDPARGFTLSHDALELVLNACPVFPVRLSVWETPEPPCWAVNVRDDLSTAI
jgi:hypothetical protein